MPPADTPDAPPTPTAPAPAVELDDVQGLAMFHRPAPYFGSHVALRISGRQGGRRLLDRLLPFVAPASAWEDTARDVCVAVAVTYDGLAAFGAPPGTLASLPVQLRDGMASRAGLLGDVGASAPEHWEEPYRRRQVHVAVSVVAPTEDLWRDTMTRAFADLRDEPELDLLGRTDHAAHPGERTSLGYRDGISFPNIAGVPPSPITTPEPPIAAGEFLLGYASENGAPLAMPAPEILARNGTYVGLRKIRTDVAAFRRFLRSNAPEAADEELLAAKLVGRWRSGAPLVLAADADDQALAADPGRVNQFGYADDPKGLVCPHGAHIRRVNPRDSALATLTNTRIHRIIRHGAVYGPPLPDGILDDDGIDRGIFFIFVSARPEALEFIKGQWINDGGFAGLGDEQDPIAGTHAGGGTFTIPHRPVRRRLHGIERFTITRGGEYAFLPGLTALRWLRDLP